MADYTAPFHLPDFTDEEFEEKKRKYHEEHGYVITFPKFTDIIKFRIYKPMTPLELGIYKSRRRHELGEKRLTEIYAMKLEKKERFERMLGAPTPKLARSWASIVQALDDAQDALLTVAVLGRIGARFLPKFLARFAIGPAGWLWLIGEILNALMSPWGCIIRPQACKRAMMRKLRRRAKGLRAKMKHFTSKPGVIPSFSEIIQMLQVTSDVYGWGISLGPIIGFATDLVSGSVRYALGQKVTLRRAPGIVEHYQKAGELVHKRMGWKVRYKWNDYQDDAARYLKDTAVVYGFERRSDPIEETWLYIAAECAAIAVEPQMRKWNPYLEVEGLEHVECEAPMLTDPLWLEIFEEKGMNPEEFCAWPSLGKRWATYEEISASVAPIAAANFDRFSSDPANLLYASLMEESAIEAALRMIALLEGEDSIEIQYYAPLSIAEMLLNHGYAFPQTVTEQQSFDFMDWTIAHDEAGTRPTLKETLAYAKNNLGFEFSTGPTGTIP